MNRCGSSVGFIRCPIDPATIIGIAAASGLRVQQGREPHLFCLFNSGRGVEPEVGADLFEVIRHELDRAVQAGTIPPWSIVAHNGEFAGKSRVLQRC